MRGRWKDRKIVNGAYRYRYAPFLVPGYSPLALPPGELSPKVTERVLQPCPLSVFASLSHLSHRERQGGLHAMIQEQAQRASPLCLFAVSENQYLGLEPHWLSPVLSWQYQTSRMIEPTTGIRFSRYQVPGLPMSCRRRTPRAIEGTRMASVQSHA